MKSKKLIALCMAAVLTSTMFAGCASKSGDDAKDSAGGKTNLEYYIWSDEESYIKKVVDKFNTTREDIQVKLNSVPNDDYDDKIKVLLSGGVDIDVLGVRTVGQMVQLKDTESLLDVTEKIKSSSLDVTAYGSMFNNVKVDEKYYGLPTRTSCWSLVYNPDLFDAAGIAYPEQMTWNEYGELAKKLTVGDGADRQWGGYWVPWIYQFAGTQRANYIIDDSLDGVEESLELLNQFYNVDKTHMSLQEMKATDSNWLAEFESGKIAMMPQGEWFIGMIMADEAAGKSTVKWDIAPIPVPEGVADGTSWGQFAFASIAASSKKADASFDFLTYLCGKDGATVYAENAMIPAYIDDEIKASYIKAVGKDSTSTIFDAKVVQEQPADPLFAQAGKAFTENADLYLLGEKDMKTTMDNFKAEREKLKAQMK